MFYSMKLSIPSISLFSSWKWKGESLFFSTFSLKDTYYIFLISKFLACFISLCFSNMAVSKLLIICHIHRCLATMIHIWLVLSYQLMFLLFFVWNICFAKISYMNSLIDWFKLCHSKYLQWWCASRHLPWQLFQIRFCALLW